MDYIDNDYELVYMIGEQDDDALKLLFDKYDDVLKLWSNYYHKIYKKFNIPVDELIQEGKIGLYYAIKNYNEAKDVKFYTFALLCIKRSMMACIAKWTRCKNLMYTNTFLYDETFVSINNYEVNPEIIFESYEYEKMIINFKNSLDFLDANIFELRYNSFSYMDIATLLGINKKKVDNSLIKIREKLKKYMLENNFVL